MQEESLKEFLIKAKKNTYALNGDGSWIVL